MQTEHLYTPAAEAPLISFIIAFYNLPAELLTRCIDSILALSLRKHEREIIVIDDGSSVSPLPHLTDYQDQIIYLHQHNQGLSNARNSGIRIATGKYIQFVDADDQLLPTPYEHCLDLLRRAKSDMVLFDFTNHPTQQDRAYSDMPMMSGSELMRNHNIQGSAWGYLFRKDTLGQLRFTPGIFHEDEEFTPLLLLRADTVVKTNAKAYLYNQRSNSIMNQQDVRHCLRRLNDSKDILKRLNRTADTLPQESKQALLRRVHQLTMDYIYNIIMLVHSRHYLNRQLKELTQMGLYPLPKRDYTRKYTWFRHLANNKLGLSMLVNAIPFMMRER